MNPKLWLFPGIFFTFFSQNCAPQKKASALNRDFVITLTDQLCKNTLHDDTLRRMQEMIWLAYSSPDQFDTKYKSELHTHFGAVTDTYNDSNKQVTQHGARELKLSYRDDDVGFLQSLLDIFLTDYGLLSYGDDLSGIEAAFSNLQLTKTIALPKYADNDDLNTYLKKISTHLKKLGLCVLRKSKENNLIVCRCNKTELFRNQLKKLDWEFEEQ